MVSFFIQEKLIIRSKLLNVCSFVSTYFLSIFMICPPLVTKYYISPCPLQSHVTHIHFRLKNKALNYKLYFIFLNSFLMLFESTGKIIIMCVALYEMKLKFTTKNANIFKKKTLSFLNYPTYCFSIFVLLCGITIAFYLASNKNL